MSNPLVGSKELIVNPEANVLHRVGLEAEKRGDFAAAHASFSEALGALSNFDSTIDTDVQVARIIRDDGFTYVHDAIVHPNDTILARAQRTIRSSAKITARLLLDGGLFQAEVPNKVRREVLAENGATVSLLGRLVTVKQVLIEQYNGQVPEHLVALGKQRYGEAHDDLRQGNNGYYRVNNAMAAARHERINHFAARQWLGRAAFGVAWTAVRDPGNLKSAVQTFGSRLRHVRSHKAAVESVRVYP